MVTKFRKEKLSRKALDELAKRNVDNTSPKTFQYTLANGQRISVSAYNIVSRNWRR